MAEEGAIAENEQLQETVKGLRELLRRANQEMQEMIGFHQIETNELLLTLQQQQQSVIEVRYLFWGLQETVKQLQAENARLKNEVTELTLALEAKYKQLRQYRDALKEAQAGTQQTFYALFPE